MIDYLSLIKKYPYVNEFISKHNISDGYIQSHLSPFLDCIESLNICRNCTGIDTCKQGKKGEVITLNYDDLVYNDITYCDKYLKKKIEDKIRANYIYSDIPSEYSDLYLKNIKLVDDNLVRLYARVEKIAQHKETRGLYIYGDLGVGKTYMCMALANTLALNGEKVAFIKSNFFINKMRQLIVNDQITYDRIINDIKESKYLIIDDIGSESVSAYSRDDLLFNILDYRMENKLTTLFTSNLSKEDLLEHYTYDKNNTSRMRAKRLLERIDILSESYVLLGQNKRRETL
ncbi:MAG: ATP-binding protein [Solobacterium sp.]|nr:ATP-binding protein [Solobacterium sp.]MDY2952414.1 ATP-binding protein [Erysipelotrichaceae bacterium]MCI6696520.1 ATP-binding protein [Solobacterium sp.]MCI6846098.1 ATP-binding protein [Solobacterium sp.]MCI6877530.1 ATP-binding protein [Solobacterium sp.]